MGIPTAYLQPNVKKQQLVFGSKVNHLGLVLLLSECLVLKLSIVLLSHRTPRPSPEMWFVAISHKYTAASTLRSALIFCCFRITGGPRLIQIWII